MPTLLEVWRAEAIAARALLDPPPIETEEDARLALVALADWTAKREATDALIAEKIGGERCRLTATSSTLRRG